MDAEPATARSTPHVPTEHARLCTGYGSVQPALAPPVGPRSTGVESEEIPRLGRRRPEQHRYPARSRANRCLRRRGTGRLPGTAQAWGYLGSYMTRCECERDAVAGAAAAPSSTKGRIRSLKAAGRNPARRVNLQEGSESARQKDWSNWARPRRVLEHWHHLERTIRTTCARRGGCAALAAS